MRNIKLIMLVMLITTFSVNAQQLVLKKLTPQEIQKLKKKTFKPLPFIPQIKKIGNKNTEVVKTDPGTSSETTEKGDGAVSKGCISVKNNYKIIPEALTPTNPNMGIKLGNVYNIEKFVNGIYQEIPYTSLSDFTIRIGEVSLLNDLSINETYVPAGSSKSAVSSALNEFVRGCDRSILSNRNSRIINIEYATSDKKLKAKLGLSYSDVADNSVKINTSLETNNSEKKYTMMYKEENYAEEIVMDGNRLMESNQDYDNLVYVSKVIFGRVGFVNYTTKDSIFDFKVDASAKGNYSGMTFGASGSLELLNKATSGNLTAKIYGSPSSSKLPTDINTFKNWVNENPNPMAMVPVGFILRFVNDNTLAYFVTSGSDPIQVCLPESEDDRFDVKIELLNINCKSVCELDGKEDLWGKQAITYATTTSKGKKRDLINDDVILWEKSESDSNNLHANKKININVLEDHKIKNLTREELENLEIWIGGKLYDYEKPPLSDVKSVTYTCLNCNQPQSNPFKRVFKVGKLNDRLKDSKNNSLRNLNLNEYTPLKVGDDYFMNLDYEEGSSICKSKISSNYQISVKKHY